MPELILAVDVGTTSTRAAVMTPDGAVAGRAAAPLKSTHPAPGRVEQDAGKVWRATRRVMAGALRAADRAPADIAAIGLTTQRASAVVWDRRSGKPLSPLVVWSDLRGVARATELARAGFMLAPQQAATKLEAVLAQVKAPRDHIAWGNIDSYLIFRLTGGAVHATDRSQAWPSGYLGFPGLGWNAPLIEHQGLDPAMFPVLRDTWGPMGVTARAAFGAEVPVTADVADQQGALIAHGTAAGTAKITWGTSATFDLATGTAFTFPGPAAPPLLVSSTSGETLWCVEGMVLSAGAALDWLRETCGLGGHDRFEALAAQAPDAGGAAFLPALQGLGAPHGDPARRGVLAGLTNAVGRPQLARAGLEGLAFRAREVVEHVYGLTGQNPPEVLGVDGGLATNHTFLQVLADLIGRPVRRHAMAEATLLGAAMCAGRGARILSDTDAAALVRFEPPVAPSLGADEAAARFAAWRSAVYG
ncbi:MAG: glpK [Caulobacteraceae bacterium]|nr:glpK [Caulobacteraceae bacterium]